MDITGQESGLKTTGGSVQDDSPRDQERSKTVVNTSQSLNGGGTTEQKHRADDEISTEAEEQESLVGTASPSGIHDLTHRMSGRGDFLERNGENTEKQDLDGGTRSIPKRRQSCGLR
jgi:hypothetical protein